MFKPERKSFLKPSQVRHNHRKHRKIMNPMLSAVLFASNNGGDSGGGFIHAVLFLIIAGIILGILLWLVSVIPLIPAIFKQVLTWIIYLVAALILINFLLSLIGHRSE